MSARNTGLPAGADAINGLPGSLTILSRSPGGEAVIAFNR